MAIRFESRVGVAVGKLAQQLQSHPIVRISINPSGVLIVEDAKRNANSEAVIVGYYTRNAAIYDVIADLYACGIEQ